MLPDHCRKVVLKRIAKERNRRRKLFDTGIIVALSGRRVILEACLLATVISKSCLHSRLRNRSCRRLLRNNGWWLLVWNTYSNERFKKTFRVSRNTFNYILSRIRHKLERKTVCEDPISPECRLGLCLYRLGRGDYFYTFAEMIGLGRSTVSTVVGEVTEAIVTCMWKECITTHMPVTEEDFKNKILDMEELWQFPFSWGAVDGCHIPIKCPPGGAESMKEYHNFKNVYSVVLMAIVDAKYRFVWGSCGFPGNSHDSVILQSTSLWADIKGGRLPNFSQFEQGIYVPPLLLTDSAFPMEAWLMKPYSNAILTKEQRYFNYRLSRARMVVEGAYGQLKGRWRFLLRKSESNHFEVKMATLACMVLHNVCLEQGDTLPAKLDLTIDTLTNEKRDRATIRDVLLMKSRGKSVNPNSKQADKVRLTISKKLMNELNNTCI